MRAWLRSRLPTGRYVLLAESFSGPLALRLAAEPPPGLAGVVLCCTFARGPLPALRPLRRLLPLLPMPKSALALLAPLLLGRMPPAGLLAALRSALQPVSAAVLRARLHAVLDVDLRDRLGQIRLPVLVLSAAADHVVPRAATAELVTG